MRVLRMCTHRMFKNKRVIYRSRLNSTQGRSIGRKESGKIHPMAIFHAIAQIATDDYIAVADGGDLLSFARIGLEADTYMDAGAFGCLGVGVPFAIAASLAYPNRMIISVKIGRAHV